MKEQEETYEQDITRIDKCCNADLPSKEAIKLQHEVFSLKQDSTRFNQELLNWKLKTRKFFS